MEGTERSIYKRLLCWTPMSSILTRSTESGQLSTRTSRSANKRKRTMTHNQGSSGNARYPYLSLTILTSITILILRIFLSATTRPIRYLNNSLMIRKPLVRSLTILKQKPIETLRTPLNSTSLRNLCRPRPQGPRSPAPSCPPSP